MIRLIKSIFEFFSFYRDEEAFEVELHPNNIDRIFIGIFISLEKRQKMVSYQNNLKLTINFGKAEEEEEEEDRKFGSSELECSLDRL